MHHIQLMALGIYIASMKAQTIYSKDTVFAIAGSNATLEWILGYSKEETDTTSITVVNTRGITIAQVEDMKCEGVNNSTVHCEIMYREKQCFLSVVLVNITQGNSENFTGLIKSADGREINITQQLIVIDKPQIRTTRKPTLHEPMNITCNSSGKLQGANYRWKLNGSYLNSTGRICARSAILTIENVTMEDKLNMLSCEVCTECSFCVDSETYTPDPYYGPYNVTLSPKESKIYLKENDNFRLECSAECNPNCTFMWDGYIKSWNYELVIGSFNSRMTGEYICIARNQETNTTAMSYSIVLHLSKGFGLEQYWIGPLIVSVFLLIVVLLILVTHWSNKTTRGEELCQPCVGLTEREASPKRLERPNKPLPMPTVQENAWRRTKRLGCSKIQRKSRSLHNLSDQTRSVMNQVREIVPLQTFSQASNTTKRQIENRVNNKRISEHDKCPWSIVRSTNESIPQKLFERTKRDHTVSSDDHNICAKSQDPNNPRKDNFGRKLQEDLYSTIDEDAMSVYQHGINNVIEEKQQETERSTEHVFYDYAHSIEICHVETDNVHVTDETYITPKSDLAHPFEICQDQETDLLETDHTYLTLIDDLPNPLEISQVEETDMHETDQTYITPITG